MQTQEEVECLCYQNVLDEAEEHMNPKGGVCRDCASCHRYVFDAAPNELADELNVNYGICTYDEVKLVNLDEFHLWEDCWSK